MRLFELPPPQNEKIIVSPRGNNCVKWMDLLLSLSLSLSLTHTHTHTHTHKRERERG
jgi:hypothetical protein